MNKDNIKGVFIPDGKNIRELFTYWILGGDAEKKMIVDHVIFNKRCVYEQYLLDDCLKDSNKCDKFMEILKQCQKK